MRLAAGLFGGLCGAVIVAIVARYGYRTADNAFDGYIWAFMFGMIALGGLFGHALSARLWRQGYRLASVLVGVVAFLALTINLSNSLGAMAGRSNEKQAGRVKVADIVRDARRDLDRAQGERAGMRFIPTDEASVIAARTASAAATKSREAECAKRGDRCRDREGDERKALEALQNATSGKASTDRAVALDGEIARLKAQIEAAGPVLDANPQGSALARLFNLPESWAEVLSIWQYFSMAIVAELLIVVSLIAFELLGKPDRVTVDTRPATALEPIFEPVEHPRRFPEPSKPKLVASRSEPVGSVTSIMDKLLEPSEMRCKLTDVRKSYVAACKRQGLQPVSPEEFAETMATLCRKLGISWVTVGDHVYLNKVRVKNLKSA